MNLYEPVVLCSIHVICTVDCRFYARWIVVFHVNLYTDPREFLEKLESKFLRTEFDLKESN